jgi:hypothetical protein
VAADVVLYRSLRPRQASRALNGLREIGAVERARQARWYVVDPVLRPYLASRHVEPLSFVRRGRSALTSEVISFREAPLAEPHYRDRYVHPH